MIHTGTTRIERRFPDEGEDTPRWRDGGSRLDPRLVAAILALLLAASVLGLG